MTLSISTQLFGTAAGIGGVAVLPDTAGSSVVLALEWFIRISFTLVIVSSISLKFSKWLLIRKLNEKSLLKL